MTSPRFVLIAGANGAGRSTSAASVLPPSIPILNADEIALRLPTTFANNDAILAGRLLIQRWDEMDSQRRSFATETTLAARSLAPRIVRMLQHGYEFDLIILGGERGYGVARVAERVRRGGHDIPEPTIRRRYDAGIRNLFALYMPLAHTRRVFDNSHIGESRLIAQGNPVETKVHQLTIWQQITSIKAL